jgi:hypothetical protein
MGPLIVILIQILVLAKFYKNLIEENLNYINILMAV